MAETGLIHVYTGNGKGKTCAALGLAMRARGAGLKVLFSQLFKNHSSEDNILKKLGVKRMQYTSAHPLFKQYTQEGLAAEAEKCLAFLEKSFGIAAMEHYDVLIIDEIGPAMNSKLLKTNDAVRLLKNKPHKLELVLTGRSMPSKVMKLSDYVSIIGNKAHPYEKGVLARKGIDF